jgi:hypothetical protein
MNGKINDLTVAFNFRHVYEPAQTYRWNPETDEVEWIRPENGSSASTPYSREDVNIYLNNGVWIIV